MDVNTLLCVGRTGGFTHEQDVASPRKRLFASPNRSECAGASRTELNGSYGDVTRKFSLSDKSSPVRKSRASLSPRTRSILRGSVSPKQGSPSSVRSVRFSDDETSEGNSSEFSKIHVNEMTQTEDVKRKDSHTNEHLKEMEGQGYRTPSVADRLDKSKGKENKKNHKPPLIAYNPKSHTDIFRTEDDGGNTSPTIKPKASKIPRLDKSWSSSDRQQTDGSQIIKNIPLKVKPVTFKTQTKLSANDGRKIIQNMQFEPRRNSIGSQTYSIPDGQKIVQNMELTTPVNMDILQVSESESKATNIGVQTEDLEVVMGNEKAVQTSQNTSTGKEKISNRGDLCYKSISVQTMDERGKLGLALEQSKGDGSKIIQNMQLTRFKSIGIQTVDIPNGNRITQNMVLGDARKSKLPDTLTMDMLTPDKPARGFSQADNSTQGVNESKMDSEKTESIRKLHDTKDLSPRPTQDGNAIIKNMCKTAELLDLMSLDSDSSDSFDISLSSIESPRKDPIIVYNSSANSESNDQNISKNSWESDVSEEIIDHCAMSLLQRDQSLNKGKLDIPVRKSQTLGNTQSKVPLKQEVKDAYLAKQIQGKGIPRLETDKVGLSHWDHFLQTRTYQGFDRTTGKIVPMFYKPFTPSDTNQHHRMHEDRADERLQKRQHFVKTPVETYSFKPSSFSNSSKSNHPTHSTPRDMSPRNAFIRELDLGPVPRVSEGSLPNTTKQQTKLNLSPRDRFVKPVRLHTPPMPHSSRQQTQHKQKREQLRYDSAKTTMSTSTERPSVSRIQRPISASESRRCHSLDIKKTSRSPVQKSLLTSNLNQIRNTAIRKSSMHTSHDYPASAPIPSNVYAMPFSHDTNRKTRTARYTTSEYQHEYGSSKKIERQSRSRDRTSRSPRLSPSSSAKSLGCKYSTMKNGYAKTEGKAPLYLNSLTAESNKRPDPRERQNYSRSRSPSPKPHVVEQNQRKIVGNGNDINATTSFGAINKSGGQALTNSARQQSPSPHRPVEGRKPPLPVNKRQQSKSPSPCRSNSPTAANERSMNDKPGYNTREPYSAENANNEITSNSSSKLSKGKAPVGVENKNSEFLDEKTMLKIIKEANL